MAYSSAVAITAVDIADAGIDVTTLPTTPTATHGNKVLNDGLTFVMVDNGSGAPITVTIDTPGTVDGLAIENREVAVGAGKRYAIRLRPVHSQSDGYAWITCSSTTSVTIGAFRLPRA
jgi:hypothetical protein